jgi:hypothetical protein
MKISNLHRLILIGLSICAFNARGQQSPANVETRVNEILSQMTLDEKLSYIGGTGFFDVKPIPVPNLNAMINPQIIKLTARWAFVATSRVFVFLRDFCWLLLGIGAGPGTKGFPWVVTREHEVISPFLVRAWISIACRWVDEISNT